MVEETTVKGAKATKASWNKIFEAGKGKFFNKSLEKLPIKEVLEEIPYLVLLFGSG